MGGLGPTRFKFFPPRKGGRELGRHVALLSLARGDCGAAEFIELGGCHFVVESISTRFELLDEGGKLVEIALVFIGEFF